MLKLKVINLFGAPGVGKSTLAAGLFNIMKTRGHSVELVTEVAKDMTWSKNWMALSHQPTILAEQDYRLRRLEGQVEWAITDSPLPCQSAYMGQEWLDVGLDEMAYDLYDRYVNFHVLVERGPFKYQDAGRNQTAEQAMILDNVMDQIFHTSSMDTPEFALEVKASPHATHEIYQWLVDAEVHYDGTN